MVPVGQRRGNSVKMKTGLELPGLANRLHGGDEWKKGVKSNWLG